MNIRRTKGSVEPGVVDRYGLIASFAGPIAMAVGVLVLVGWVLGMRTLTSVIPHFTTMKPNTALSFVFAGFSLWLLRLPSGQAESNPKHGRLGQTCAVLVAFLGLLTLGECFFHLNLGIDQTLLRDTLTDTRVAPGRMSIPCAFGFLILGSSLFFLARKSPHDAMTAQILALVGLVDALLAFLGYVYGVHGLYAVSHYTTMALHTALVFVLLCVGTLFARPHRGLISVITSQYSGGQMARLILPLALTLPLFIGWLRLIGEHAGFYGTGFGFALFATSNVIIFTILVWISAKSLNTHTAELVQSAHRYRFLADAMPQIVWTAKPDGNIDYYNKRWFDYTGMTFDQTKDWGWKATLHPDDLQNCIERWKKAFTTACEFEVEFRLRHTSGGVYRWHIGRAFPWRNQTGQIIQWVGTCTDIDDQKRARDELENRVAERSVELAGAREKLQAVLDASTHVSIIALDTKGLITVFNRGSEQMLGYTSAEMVGKQPLAIIHLESEVIARSRELTEEMGRPVEGFEVFVEKARNGQHEEREWTYVRKDGKTLTVNVAVTASYDSNGTVIGFLGVAMDVTARTRAEKTLRDQALILDLANDTIFIRDREDRITYWNQGAQRLYGWSKEEAIGQLAQLLLQTQHPQSLDNINGQLLATGHWEGELVHTRRDGALVTVSSSWTLQRDDSNRPVSVIEMDYDITARKKAEWELKKSRERLDAILSSSLDGIIVYEAVRDEQGVLRDLRFTMINPAAEKLMGLNAPDLLGQTLLESLPELATDGFFEKLSRIIEENVALDSEHQSLGSEPPRWYRLAGVKLGDGLALSFTEITARKLFERQLQDAKERAELADNAKGDFLATMSHEIRTPMSGVIGMTDMLLDTRLDVEQRNMADTIRISAASLLRLINDILDFSKIEAGQLSFEELDFDLRKVVEDTLEMMAGQAQAKGIELVSGIELEVPAKVRGDPGRIQQVLTNLVGNAIKFTKSGEVAIRVTVQAETETEVHLRFEIKDTGAGIASATLARLFQPFVQADSSTSRNFGGTGLGLAICKRLAESMNGSIGVESTLGEGSTFWVTLKLYRQIEAKIQSPIMSEFVDTRVLIVDDNETSRQFLHKQIVAWRLHSECASTGEEALAILHQSVAEKAPCSVAIIDMQMPEMDGLALVRKMKADPELKATRVLLLTPFGKPIPTDELKKANIAACCVKPVRQSALFDSLVQVLTPSSSAREPRAPEPLLKSSVPLLSRKESILLAEDNPVNQQVALGNLLKLGYDADVVNNGTEVLNAIEMKRYDIILMDCQMPELDGYEVTKIIRQRERRGERTWIIAMTANAMVGDREKCLTAGMDDYLSKPLRRAELRAAMERGSAKPEAPLDHNARHNIMADGEAELVEWTTSTQTTIKDIPPALEKSNASAPGWDVTERDRLRATLATEQRFLSTLMDNLPDNVWFKDRDSRFVATNRAMRSWIGFKSQTEIIGKTDQDFFSEEHADAALADEQKILATGQPIIGLDEKETWPDGHETWVSTTKMPWRDASGSVIGIFGWSRDITARKLADENLKAANEAAEKAGRAKSEFLVNMSHEIRTPMNGVIGMADLLLDSDLDREQREFAEILRTSADTLLKTIHDILDFSKIEACKLTFEILDFDLVEAVESTLDMLAEHAQGKGVELAGTILPGTPTRLRGDPGRLRQILSNLIGNAIKFTETGEAVVRVSKEGETETYAVLRFEVQDTGIGISPEAQARLFQAFNQADGSSTRKYGGTGLGLAIAKQLVEMMQGQIGVRSQHGKGSTFWFTARLEKQVSAVKVPERSFRDLYNFQVLVVDDNAANRDILRHQILAWKMQANSAASGAEALKILRAAAAECKPYDLALLDVQMAEMDGLTLARAIKADPTITGTRLILLTGFSKRISPPQPRAEGIMECCFKPVRQSRLFECLANALLGPSTTPRTFAKALIAPLTGLSPEAKTESLAKVDDFAIDAVQSSLSEGMLQSSKELGSTIGVSSSHGLTEAFERDANCQLGTTRWACAGGDTRRLREEAEEFDGASCTIDAQVTGGICRYEIRSGVCGASMKTTLVNAGSYYQARETFEGMYPAATLASIICQGPSHERNFLPVQLVSEFTPIPSRYLFVSHMGSNDSNSKWFDLALKAFQERYPSVKAEYLSTNECSTQKYVQLIEHAISTKPDGLVVAITDAAALDGVLRKAISQGIPVIAFNTPDLREPAARIPYLTFVGTNYHSDGKRAGEHALAHAKSGEIPLAKQVLCANPAPAHGGLLARCKGMTEAMNVAGIKTETLVTDSDPALASYILRAYLMRNPDVNYIYAVTGDSGPAVWDVCNKMGLHPDLGDEAHNVTIIGVDDNPVSLSGVKAGHLLSTVSQEFWLQGYVPLQWLYWYREYGYTPESDTLTGPVIIDKTNVDQWIALVQGVIGADNFRSQIPW
jgi:two-component system sensor histidine kinase/response regulator